MLSQFFLTLQILCIYIMAFGFSFLWDPVCQHV